MSPPQLWLPQQSSMRQLSMQRSSESPSHVHFEMQPLQPSQLSPSSERSTHTSSGDGGAQSLSHSANPMPPHAQVAMQSAQSLQPVARVHCVTGGSPMGGPWQAAVHCSKPPPPQVQSSK